MKKMSEKNKLIEFFGIKTKKQLKEELKKTIKFFIAFIIVFIALNLALFFVPLIYFEALIANTIKLILSFQQINAVIELKEPVLMHLNEKTIIISYLCTGLLELTLIVSLIIGSIGIPLKKRIIGSLIAIPLTYAFNIARIIITINAIMSFNETIVDLVHNLLFRITLFIVIVGFYFFWFFWATNKHLNIFKIIK